MTTTTDTTSTDEPARVLSVRTLRTYAADWALFTDRCAATDTTALPADPRVVVDFLHALPPTPSTICRQPASSAAAITSPVPRLLAVSGASPRESCESPDTSASSTTARSSRRA